MSFSGTGGKFVYEQGSCNLRNLEIISSRRQQTAWGSFVQNVMSQLSNVEGCDRLIWVGVNRSRMLQTGSNRSDRRVLSSEIQVAAGLLGIFVGRSATSNEIELSSLSLVDVNREEQSMKWQCSDLSIALVVCTPRQSIAIALNDRDAGYGAVSSCRVSPWYYPLT